MPGWQPNWTDVRFDHGAAAQAIVELEATARVLVETGGDLARSADIAQQEWRGRYRQRFDDERAALERERESLIGGLRADADRIRQAAEAATYEQRRREDDRGRWRTEDSAERARVAAAAAQAQAQATAQVQAAQFSAGVPPQRVLIGTPE